MTHPAPTMPLALHRPHCGAPVTVSTRSRRDEPARCPTCGKRSALIGDTLAPAPAAAERGQA